MMIEIDESRYDDKELESVYPGKDPTSGQEKLATNHVAAGLQATDDLSLPASTLWLLHVVSGL